MNKKITSIKILCLLVTLLGVVNFGFGQINITGLGAGNTYTQDFNTLANTGTSNTLPVGWSFSESGTNSNTTYTAGTGSGAAGDTYSFGSPSSSDRSFGGLLSGSLIPTIGVSFTNNTGSFVSELTISFTGEQWRLGATGRVDRLDFQYSTNATSLTTGTWTNEDNLDFIAPTTIGTTGALDGNTVANRTFMTFTITGLAIGDGSVFWLKWNDFNATSSDDGLGIDDFSIYAMGLTDKVDFCSVDFPENGTIIDGGNFIVYGQAYEPGVTEAVGQATGLNAWIGYSLTDASTIADFISPDWTWVDATFNSQQGNNDQFEAEIGSLLSSGAYYYVSRFQLNGGPYTYGGKTPTMLNGGNFWNGTNYVSGVLTVEADQVDFCNLDYPKTASITTGSTFNIYAQAYEPGITDSAGQGSSIQAWIGYNTINEDYEPWQTSGWTWIEATYGSDESNDFGNPIANDQYVAEIGCGLPAGIYYYASRFQLNGSNYSYGGITSDNVGNFWTLNTINSGTLTITDPPLANVVITEIMYNSSGTDDEWIEICNLSGSSQDISNYIISVEGTPRFTFPCGTTIANGSCVTINLGDGGGPEFNFDCPFTADYSNSLGNGTLGNTSGTITLKASNEAISDTVTYNNSDGGNGNGSSLHVIDVTQDNSDTATNWQEVAYGGSSGLNSLLPSCLPSVVEINVEGNLGTFPNIPDDNTNSNIPNGTNNTLFSTQYIGSSQSKSYRIQNLGGLDLTISSISINGTNPNDFSITLNPISPIIYGSPTILEITFAPLSPGVKNAIVTINNNDPDENPYTFNIRGTGLCVTGSNTITPSSGPEGTIVTVTGTNLTSASASFNGLSATVNHISSTEMEVVVPNGAVTGNLEIIDDQPCTSIIPFTVIDNQVSSCEGGSSLTEIFISEITDATYGGLSYIELYNPSNGDIDLSNYSIDIYINGNTDSLDTGKYKTQALSGTILAGQTFVISTGYSGSYNCDGQPGGDSSYSNFNSTTLGGINKEANKHDYIALLNSGNLVDEFGVFGDSDWMDTLHTTVSGDRGFDFKRKNTATSFSDPFDDNDWDIIDWIGTGLASCGTNDYSDISVYDFSTGTPPSITTQPIASSSTCDLTATLTVEADEGFVGNNPLAYQWYYSKPGDVSWTIVPNSSPYSGETTNVLDISSTIGLNGYQYYCQVRENTITCYKASNAVRLDVYSTTWNGTTWSNGTPTLGTVATIDGDYDTASNGDFSACSLIINDGSTLTISDGNFVEVENDLTVNGNIIVQPQGSFVQNNDDGSVEGVVLSDKTKIVVNKNTASPANNWYEYTYWSSPVKGETIGDGLFESTTNRRYIFNAQNYLDHCAESNNDNNCIPGFQDNIDDDGNDWQWVNGATVMKPGIGYASTHDAIIFGSTPGCPGTSCSIEYTFNGPFNNGIITVPVYRNDSEFNDNNSNLIGNPYPSAISADDFFDLNVYNFSSNPDGALEGVIYLWSQNTQPSATANGNQGLNFSELDYAVINGIDGTAGGDKVIPNRFIPSGQGFFVNYSNYGGALAVNGDIVTGEVIFNNAMRVTGNNNQFFKASNSKHSKSNEDYNKLWVNLTSDIGVFNQILVGYVNGATNDFDGMYYDAPRNLTPKTAAALYSLISDNQSKYVIQGKNPNSLNLSEVIPLGFYTAITGATLYNLSIAQFKGDFFNTNTIYLKDNLMNTVHNLSESNYTFTSEIGEFRDRFEIVFQSETLSDIEAQLNSNKLTVIELNDGSVEFKTNSDLIIKTVKIFDVLGRTLYQLKGSNSSEIYNLSNLSQSTYITKVELSNGQIVTKKALKRI